MSDDKDDRDVWGEIASAVSEAGARLKISEPVHAFARWFAELYYDSPENFAYSSGDDEEGTGGLFFDTISGGRQVSHLILATLASNYGEIAPRSFYANAESVWPAFNGAAEKASARQLLADSTGHLRNLFARWDEGWADVLLLTNFRCHPARDRALTALIPRHYLEDLVQDVLDDFEDAAPRMLPLKLHGIDDVLIARAQDSDVRTSVVFARVRDFVTYMKGDKHDHLFARNIRHFKTSGKVNDQIRATFIDSPLEFLYSNNGITIVGDRMVHDTARREVRIDNPRVVNGSQTLHSVARAFEIRGLLTADLDATVVVRIVTMERTTGETTAAAVAAKKAIVDKIAARSNSQNPIRSFNLVANDGFNHSVRRFFRRKKVHYENREHEWRQRKVELAAEGYVQGPNLKRLAQLIASFHWNKSEQGLGPAHAYSSVGKLFENEATYGQIASTTPELAYQLYLSFGRMESSLKALQNDSQTTRQAIRALGTQARFALFALTVRVLSESGATWGSADLTSSLELDRDWSPLMNAIVNSVYRDFQALGGPREGANYFFKSVAQGDYLVRESAIPAEWVKAGRRIISPRPPGVVLSLITGR
jgi:hypothetical protein